MNCRISYVLANGWSCKPIIIYYLLFAKMKKFIYTLLSICLVTSCFNWLVFSQNLNNAIADMELLRYYGVVPLLLNIHEEIWMWEAWNEIIASYSSLVQNMKYYADVDVVAYLKKSINPESSLDNFLNKTRTLLNTANSFLMYMDNNKQTMVQNKENCDSLKAVSDKNFGLALKDFDSANMEKNLQISLEKEKCSVESRILYNAYDKMESQVAYYYNILQNKYDYFFSNKYDIVKLMRN